MLKNLCALEAKFFLWIAAGLVFLFLCPIWFRASSCPAHPSVNHEKNGGPIDNGEHAQNYQYRTRYLDEDISNAVSIAPQKQKTSSDKERTYATNKDIVGLFSDLLCDVHITEIALVYFTYCLVIVGWFTIRSGERTSAIFERPYVTIDAITNVDGLKDVVEIRITNFGRSIAFTGVLQGDFYIRDDPPVQFKPQHTHEQGVHWVIPTGDRGKVTTMWPHKKSADDIKTVLASETKLFFLAVISYRDAGNNWHNTGVCSVYNTVTKGFFPAGGPAHNFMT